MKQEKIQARLSVSMRPDIMGPKRRVAVAAAMA